MFQRFRQSWFFWSNMNWGHIVKYSIISRMLEFSLDVLHKEPIISKAVSLEDSSLVSALQSSFIFNFLSFFELCKHEMLYTISRVTSEVCPYRNVLVLYLESSSLLNVLDLEYRVSLQITCTSKYCKKQLLSKRFYIIVLTNLRYNTTLMF